MADCFDNVSPSSCVGLGSRLKNSGGAGAPNAIVLFEIADWVVFSDCTYQLTIPASIHQRGTNPLSQIDRFVSMGIYEAVGVEKITEADGTLKLRVPRKPDCRFVGRAVIDN